MSHECRLAEAWETDGAVVWCPCMKGIAYVRALGPNEGTFAPCPDPEVQKAHAEFIAAAPAIARQVVILRAALERVSVGARRFLKDRGRPTDRVTVEAIVELCADIADEAIERTKPKARRVRGKKHKPWSITLRTPAGDCYVFETNDPPTIEVDQQLQPLVPGPLSEARANLQASLQAPIVSVRYEFKPAGPVRHILPRVRR